MKQDLALIVHSLVGTRSYFGCFVKYFTILFINIKFGHEKKLKKTSRKVAAMPLRHKTRSG